MSDDLDPLKKPTRKPYEPKDDDGQWSRPSLLSWFGNLGICGYLLYVGGLFLAINGTGFCFGIFWPKLLGLESLLW